MEKITLDGGLYWFDGVAVCPIDKIIADSTEKVKGDPFFISGYSPHRIDYIMAVGDKVVGVESKTIDDLVSSWFSKRVQRQLSTLLKTVDIPILMLRLKQHSHYVLDDWPGVRELVTKFQLAGGMVMFAATWSPKTDLLKLRTFIEGGSLPLGDWRGSMKADESGSAREQALRLIPGVGAKSAKKLARYSLPELLNMSDTQLAKAGVGKRIRDGLERLKI